MKKNAPKNKKNTASGMDCMQYATMLWHLEKVSGFNTASGMDCMQSHNNGQTEMAIVSIPQAVWIACNTVSQNP
ncbi:hypothetical protein [Selenomonas sputigena]|uniref:hypothetical protein n=1 Tax=Selenomonas sputigena TaxID=69823 RepID=UPI00222FDD58|nr:hypothetical protein [Selenomonas sputigena]UZD44100.1 hypothetical protein OL240_04095 [Selenomonas sputigena]